MERQVLRRRELVNDDSVIEQLQASLLERVWCSHDEGDGSNNSTNTAAATNASTSSSINSSNDNTKVTFFDQEFYARQGTKCFTF